LGRVLAREEKNAQAIEEFDRALALDPDSAEAHYNRGLMAATIQQDERAIQEFRQASSLQPKYVDAEISLALALQQHDPAAALTVLRQAAKGSPASPEIHNNLGLVLLEAGQAQEAVNEFQTSVRLNPGYAAAHYNLGLALQKSGDAGADAEFRRAHELGLN
jgi:Flp pilus assembly protein TadD